MKQVAFFCLVLMTGTIALAQQPTEWRPNIAEDNKAATWDDTAAFVVSTINDPAVNLARGSGPWGGQRITFNATSTAKCKLMWGDLQMTSSDTNRSMHSVDLGKVDPLSISVVSWKMSGPFRFRDGKCCGKPDETTVPSGFEIALKGTNNGAFDEVTLYTRNMVVGSGFKPWASTSDAETAGCEPNDKKCTSRSTVETRSVLFFADQESAHRVARALVHGSLLCGGTKAVSPF